jgi:hypothetical protein
VHLDDSEWYGRTAGREVIFERRKKHLRRRPRVREAPAQLPDSDPALKRVADVTQELGSAVGDLDALREPQDALVRIGFAQENQGRAIAQALRAEPTDHPMIGAWLEGQRSVGNRTTLRRLRNKAAGLTCDLPKSLGLDDVWLLNALANLPPERFPSGDERSLSTKGLQKFFLERLNEPDWLPEFMAQYMMPAGIPVEIAQDDLRSAIRSRLAKSRQAAEAWLRDCGLPPRRQRRRKT